ncbi:hypothetical protein [Brachybacterium tyrofermentans]|uniref:hypothetical protein n=1 Tax=Brachybacterium tyrofermentans TaxID=47848 RepID=UPI001865DEC9|nr:hypothetical protein [Brachybacterium tyrofermentans]
MSFYNHAPAHANNVTARVSRAYVAAGQTAPASFVDALKAFTRTIPDATQVAATLAAEAYQAPADTDMTTFWDDAKATMADALAADAIKDQLTSALHHEQARTAGRQIATALGDVKPWADKQIKALVSSGNALPNGSTDPETVLAADAGAALATARAALANLGTLASVVEVAHYASSARGLVYLLPVLDIGKPTTEVVKPFGDGPINTAQLGVTLAIRELETLARKDLDAALIRVARGEVEGITLALATSTGEVGQRAAHVREAYERRTASEREQSQLMHMS